MALRRPPTRIELKADDVEEYDKVGVVFSFRLLVHQIRVILELSHDDQLNFISNGQIDGIYC